MKIKSYMEDFIRENYMSMTQKEIAEYLGEGVNCSDIQYWLKKHGLYKKKYMFSEEDIKFMIDNYEDMEYKNIAKHLGLTERQVRGKLNNMGYTKLRDFDKHYFHNIDSDLKAYFLGFIFADGYVVCRPKTRNYEFAMQLQSEDKYILEAINKELGGVHEISHNNPKDKIINGVKTRSGHSDTLRIYSKDIVYDLIDCGIVPDKTHNYTLPSIPDKYFFDFLRGYIDGDGCYYNRNGNVNINITCACKDVLDWIKDVLCNHSINTHVYKEKDLKYRLVCTSQNDVKRLVNLLYHDNFSMCLSRKYNKIVYLLDGRPD